MTRFGRAGIFLVLMFFLFTASCNGSNQASSPTLVVPTSPPASSTVSASAPSATVLPSTPTSLPNPINYVNPQVYQVEYQARFVRGNFTVSSLQVYESQPVEWDSQKDVQILSTMPDGTQSEKDSFYGNGIYYWKLSNEVNQALAENFGFSVKLTAYETLTNIDPAGITAYDVNSADYKLYTRPERFIESNDSAIVSLANQLSQGKSNPYEMARAFYDYVMDNIHFKKQGKGLLGAKAALQSKSGEAGEYAALFVALCRAKGIPARPVVGYYARTGLDQGAVWAEFYLPPFGWIPADPMTGQVKNRNYYFGNMDNQRVILDKGFNIMLVPSAPGKFVAPYLQVPWFWFYGKGSADTVSLVGEEWNVTRVP